jgi:hypothetical protein
MLTVMVTRVMVMMSFNSIGFFLSVSAISLSVPLPLRRQPVRFDICGTVQPNPNRCCSPVSSAEQRSLLYHYHFSRQQYLRRTYCFPERAKWVFKRLTLLVTTRFSIVAFCFKNESRHPLLSTSSTSRTRFPKMHQVFTIGHDHAPLRRSGPTSPRGGVNFPVK